MSIGNGRKKIMRANDFKNKNKIKALKFSLYQTPHATIEPNRTCNIQCRSCYTLNRTHVKSLDEVKHEIDLETLKQGLYTLDNETQRKDYQGIGYA